MLNPAPSNADVHLAQAAESNGELLGASLHALFDLEEAGLLRYAFALTGRRAVAEEIVQEVFLQLHARWDQVEMPRAWLYRSVRNRGLDHLRKCKREKLQCDDDQTSNAIDRSDGSPESILTQIESVVRLRQMLEHLSEDDQRLIRLKYFEGRKYREISEQTGLSIGNVGYRLHHIMQQLATQLRPLGIDESK